MEDYIWVCSNPLWDFVPDRGLQFYLTTLKHVGIDTTLLGLVNIATYVILIPLSYLRERSKLYNRRSTKDIVSPSLT